MEVVALAIPDVKLLRPSRHVDARGFFSETYSRRHFQNLGFDVEFLQDNHSRSRTANVVRGLHFQLPPFAQDKLLRVLRGAVFDVAVDLRHGSPTFGRHVSVVLSEDDWSQIFVPAGFAHGFCTLMPDTEIFYKVTNYYSAKHDRGLLWNDPDLAIDWPVGPEEACLSDRDQRHPRLRELPVYFENEASAPELAVV